MFARIVNFFSLLCGLLLGLPVVVSAVHFSPAEVSIWQARRTAGPFASDYTTILGRANTFRTTPSADTWLGNQLNEPWVATDVKNGNMPPNAHPDRRQGDGLRDAGFVYLLTGDTSYRDAVRSALLSQAAIAGTNFANTVKWNPNAVVLWEDDFQIANWIRKLAYGYSYVRADLSGGDRTTIDAWFLQAATYWDSIVHNWVSERFPNRYSDVYGTPDSPYNPGTNFGLTHFGGETVFAFHDGWVNIPATHNTMVAVVGILLNNATLKDHAKRFVKEWLTYNVAPDGTVVDQYRWNTTATLPAQTGFLYAGTVIGSIVATADHFARAGDTELYDYTTTGGLFGWDGGTKSLLGALRRYAQITLGERGLANGISIYASNTSTTSATLRIGPGTTHNHDTFMIPANIYFNDALVKQAYTRVMPSSPASSGYDVWGGDWGTYSGIRFMFGLQEGAVFPYPAPPFATPDYTSNLRMHLKFDEGTDSTAEDSTANNHDGTLDTGATWGAAQMGASAVTVDGTADGVVTVSGGLTNPTTATLAAWVFPTAWPGGFRDVINLRDAIILRALDTGSVRGSFYTGAGYSGMTVTAGLALNVWHHLAYTVTPGAQRLYVNGTLVGSSSAGATVQYTGLPVNTLVGNHPTNPSNAFVGSIDDVRVYTRALSATDIAGLADLEDPPPLGIQITTPTPNPSHNTSSAVLATLGGVASDDIGVTSVTWTCATCTPPVDSATCTPACGAATTFTNWRIPLVTLGVGTNLITVTAADASGLKTDQITVTYTEPPPVGACTHYASQVGGGNGLSPGSPFRVIDFYALATPGSTLCVSDGTLTGNNSMIQLPSGLSGTDSLPITIRALNDGAVTLDGENARNPVVVGATNQWIVVEGFDARRGLTAVYQFLGDNNRGKRLVGWDGTSGQANAVIFEVRGTNTRVEDCIAWGQNARTILQGSGEIDSPGGGYSRCWAEWNDHPGGTTSAGATYRIGRGQRFENILGTSNAVTQ